MGTEIVFISSDPVGSTKSSEGFVGILTIKLAELTNSTLSFIGNSSLNGIIVECHDSGNFPVDIRNITLSYVDAGTYIVFVIITSCNMYTVCRYTK